MTIWKDFYNIVLFPKSKLQKNIVHKDDIYKQSMCVYTHTLLFIYIFIPKIGMKEYIENCSH